MLYRILVKYLIKFTTIRYWILVKYLTNFTTMRYWILQFKYLIKSSTMRYWIIVKYLANFMRYWIAINLINLISLMNRIKSIQSNLISLINSINLINSWGEGSSVSRLLLCYGTYVFSGRLADNNLSNHMDSQHFGAELGSPHVLI